MNGDNFSKFFSFENLHGKTNRKQQKKRENLRNDNFRQN